MTLEEAIQQQLTLGKNDPLEIARAITKQQEPEWIAAELLALSEELIAEIARHRLGSVRRSSLATIVRGPKREARLAPVWIPNAGWKRLADLTVDDLRALEKFYARLRDAAAVRVTWCSECIALMLGQEVAKLGQIKGAIPSVPEIEEAA